VTLLPPPPERAPDLDDDFTAPKLNDSWTAHYLPHWTTPDRSAARFDLTGAGLRLRIDADQPHWRPEDAPLRVSNLQTGTFSGVAGSTRGIHPHRPDGLVVRTPQALRLGWAPAAGRVEVTVSASTDPGCMTAAWLVGTEHLAEGQSGEICLFEIDAEAIGPTATVARSGLKAHRDPDLVTDMADVVIPVAASRPHTWTAIWGDGELLLGCEGRELRRLALAPDYPLVLLIDLFESSGAGVGTYPKTAMIHRVRGWTSSDRGF
jgi:hypothetical protein